MLLVVEASERSSEFWRWQESATGGGLSASRPAAVSTELCDRCNNRQLPSLASLLHHRVGKVCAEHCSKVCTNSCFLSEKSLSLFWQFTCQCSNWTLKTPFPLTQKVPSSNHRVWDWFGCHLCFMWPVLQSIQFNSGLTWVTTQKSTNCCFYLYISIMFLFCQHFSLICFYLCFGFRVGNKGESQNTKCFDVRESGG